MEAIQAHGFDEVKTVSWEHCKEVGIVRSQVTSLDREGTDGQ